MQKLSRLASRFLLLIFILALPWLLLARSTPIPLGQEVTSWQEERYGIHILHLSGSNYEMGYEHGRLLRDEIRGLIQNNLYGQLIPNSPYPYPLLLAYARLVDIEIAGPYREEIWGMADATGVSYLDLVLWNVISELALLPNQREVVRELIFSAEYWSPPIAREFGSISPGTQSQNDSGSIPAPLNLGFVVFGQATADGKLLHALYPSEPWAAADLLIIVYEPEGKDAFVSLSWPGFVGVVAGMNEEKISVSGMGWPALDSSLRSSPTPFLLRQVLEESGDISSAVEILASTKRSSGYTILIGDGKPADAAVYESTAHLWRLIKSEQDYLVGIPWPIDTEMAGLRANPEINSIDVPLIHSLVKVLASTRGRYNLNMALGLIVEDTANVEVETSNGIVLAASDWQVWVGFRGAQTGERVMLLDLLEEVTK